MGAELDSGVPPATELIVIASGWCDSQWMAWLFGGVPVVMVTCFAIPGTSVKTESERSAIFPSLASRK